MEDTKMDTNGIKKKIRAGAVIIDVRTTAEFADGAYPGAINIPVNALPGRIKAIGPKDKPVIVYCASGSRSAVAHKILKVSGFIDVTNAGSIVDMPR
jgi:phage shock protein E